jgi:hypothetical protein
MKCEKACGAIRFAVDKAGIGVRDYNIAPFWRTRFQFQTTIMFWNIKLRVVNPEKWNEYLKFK